MHSTLIISARNACLIQRLDAELPAPSRACSRRRRRRPRYVVFRLTEPDTLPPSRSRAAVASSRRHRAQRAGEDEGLAGERPRRRSPRSAAAAGSPCSRPAAASLAMSARFRGSSANARTDAATTGPMSGTAWSASTGASTIAVHRPEMRATAWPPPSRRRGGCRARRPGATGRSASLRSICATTLRPTLPSFRGTRPLRARLARRDDEILELRRLRGGRGRRQSLHQPLRDQLIDERLAEPLDVHRRCATAKCSRLRRRRAGHDAFSQRQTTSSSSRCSALPHAGHVVGITHGVESAGRRRARASRPSG